MTRKNLENLDDYLLHMDKLFGLFCCVCGIGIGVCIGSYLYKPEKVYFKDLNKDGRVDLIVKREDGDKYIFLQQEDGSYKRLEEILRQKRLEIRKSESEIKDIKSKVNF